MKMQSLRIGERLALGFGVVLLLALAIGLSYHQIGAVGPRGDLPREIHNVGSDETAQLTQALARMQRALRHVVGSVRENASGVAQVGQAITQMDQATQQNAALVQESAAAAAGLKHQADALVKLVSTFRT